MQGYKEWAEAVNSQLEANSFSITALQDRTTALETHLQVCKVGTNHDKAKLEEVVAWKDRYNEILSPTRLEKLILTVEKHDRTLTRLIAALAVLQFIGTPLMAVVAAWLFQPRKGAVPAKKASIQGKAPVAHRTGLERRDRR